MQRGQRGIQTKSSSHSSTLLRAAISPQHPQVPSLTNAHYRHRAAMGTPEARLHSLGQHVWLSPAALCRHVPPRGSVQEERAHQRASLICNEHVIQQPQKDFPFCRWEKGITRIKWLEKFSGRMENRPRPS